MGWRIGAMDPDTKCNGSAYRWRGYYMIIIRDIIIRLFCTVIVLIGTYVTNIGDIMFRITGFDRYLGRKSLDNA
jgi:hypothetical protein